MYCHSLSSRSAGSNPPASWLRQPAAEPYRRLIFKPQARCPARSSKVGHGLRTYRPVRKLSHEGPSFWRCFSGALPSRHPAFPFPGGVAHGADKAGDLQRNVWQCRHNEEPGWGRNNSTASDGTREVPPATAQKRNPGQTGQRGFSWRAISSRGAALAFNNSLLPSRRFAVSTIRF
jgi:hypothetical protein